MQSVNQQYISLNSLVSLRKQLIALCLSLSVKSQEAAVRLCTDLAGFTTVSGVVPVSNAGVADCNCVRIRNACDTDNTDPATQAAAGFLGLKQRGQFRRLSIETRIPRTETKRAAEVVVNRNKFSLQVKTHPKISNNL